MQLHAPKPKGAAAVALGQYNTLFRLFEPHAPVEVWQVGPGNLKQLITKWFQGHPTFVGLETSVWCKRVTKQARCTYQFSFEHTPQ